MTKRVTLFITTWNREGVEHKYPVAQFTNRPMAEKVLKEAKEDMMESADYQDCHLDYHDPELPLDPHSWEEV